MENVNIDPSIQSAVATFVGILDLSAHQSIGNSVLDMAVRHGIKKMIIDTSNLQLVKQETTKWINDDWFPRVVSSGVKYLAYVLSKDELNNITNLNEKTDEIEIQYVDSVANAKAWMSKK